MAVSSSSASAKPSCLLRLIEWISSVMLSRTRMRNSPPGREYCVYSRPAELAGLPPSAERQTTAQRTALWASAGCKRYGRWLYGGYSARPVFGAVACVGTRGVLVRLRRYTAALVERRLHSKWIEKRIRTAAKKAVAHSHLRRRQQRRLRQEHVAHAHCSEH